jgi:hypothetical protein
MISYKQIEKDGNVIDLAKILQPSGIKKILSLLCEAYDELYTSKKININMDETKINEEFSVIIIKIFGHKVSSFKIKDKQLIPLPSKPVGKNKKIGKFPEIDICFRDKIESESFFGIECKILREDKKQNYTYYISKGVNRYLKGIYKGKCSHSSMVGYIIKGEKKDVIREIESRMNKISTISPFKLSYKINEFNDHYVSIHKLSFINNDFHIHHLFFNFMYDN